MLLLLADLVSRPVFMFKHDLYSARESDDIHESGCCKFYTKSFTGTADLTINAETQIILIIHFKIIKSSFT